MKTRAAVAYEAGKPLVVEATLPLKRINEAFDSMHAGQVDSHGRGILTAGAPATL